MSDLTCILVHGSFHGGWCWDRLLPLLPANWAVETPSLGGADQPAQVAELAALLTALPAPPHLLVAHSYAGMLVADAVARSGVTPARTVLLDAFLPRAGESAFDLLGPAVAMLRESASGGEMPPPPPEMLGVTDSGQAAWLSLQLTPMPLATHEGGSLTDAAQLAGGVYVRCTQCPLFADAQARARGMGWPVHELDAGHDAMVSAPATLARLLVSLA